MNEELSQEKIKAASENSAEKIFKIVREELDLKNNKALTAEQIRELIDMLPDDFGERFEKLYQTGKAKELIDLFLSVSAGMKVDSEQSGDKIEQQSYIITMNKFIELLEELTRKKPSARRPNLLQIDNDHYTNNFLQKALQAGSHAVRGKIPYNPKQPVSFTISTVDDTALNTKRITEYDRHLQNCIGSFMDTGQDTITLDGLCRMMIDQDTAGGTHESQRRFLWERLKEQATMFQSFKSADGIEYGGTMLSFKFVKEPDVNGNIGNVAICFTDFPILYQNAKINRQMLTVPLKLLKVYEKIEADANGKLKQSGKRVLETPERIAIKSYMLRRVALITNENRKSNIQSNRILFDTVFCECGIEVDRRHKGRYISYIELLLQNWKVQGFIHGYCIVMKGRSKTGIEINPKSINI